MSNKIPSRKARQNFIERADTTALNEYLLNMEKLANRKGGEYKIAYDEDIAFLIDNDDEDSDVDASDALALFSGKTPDTTTTTETCGETELYVNKIELLTQNTKNKKYDILDEIEDILIDENELLYNALQTGGKHRLSYNAKDAIDGYVDIILADNKTECIHDLALRIYKKILRNKEKYHDINKKENSMIIQASNRIMELLPNDPRNTCLKEYFWEYQNIKKKYPRELQKDKIQQLNDKYAKYRDTNKLPIEWTIIAKIIRRRAKEDTNIRQTS